MRTISALIDFSETSSVATQYACWLAKKNNAKVNLLHIAPNNDISTDELEKKLIDFTKIKDQGVSFSVSVGSGDYTQQIPRLLQLSDSDFVVIGTHGVKGIFQTLFGANVIKMIQGINISALVVQDNTPLPKENISHILFPMGPHENFQSKIEETAKWAKSINATVDVFCLIKEDGEIHDSILKNLEKTKDYFDKEGINYKTVMRESRVYSIGYAKEILNYAEESNCGLLTIMSQISEENRYFGNVDKTNMVLNPKGIPVLCIAGK